MSLSTSQNRLADIDATVCGWLKQRGAVTLAAQQGPLTVLTKTSARDLVTSVDRENDQFFRNQIHDLMPNAQIVSEETTTTPLADMTGDVWFVDPLDGTINFVHAQHDFGIMLAWYRDGVPVLAWLMSLPNSVIYHGGPALGVLKDTTLLPAPEDHGLATGLVALSGRRLLNNRNDCQGLAEYALGYRVFGSASATLIRLLCGELVAYTSQLSPWDIAAGRVLAETLGIRVTTIDGSPLNMLRSNVILTATKQAHHEILTLRKG